LDGAHTDELEFALVQNFLRDSRHDRTHRLYAASLLNAPTSWHTHRVDCDFLAAGRSHIFVKSLCLAIRARRVVPDDRVIPADCNLLSPASDFGSAAAAGGAFLPLRDMPLGGALLARQRRPMERPRAGKSNCLVVKSGQSGGVPWHNEAFFARLESGTGLHLESRERHRRPT